MKKVNIKRSLNRKIYSAIEECIKVAELSEIKIYLVGGIVRDILLKRPLHDIDITVEGNARHFVEILDCYVKTKSIKYNETLPTAKVVFKNGVEIDFASTRKEFYEKFGDLPKISETGCSLKEDIKRRDFTVNTLIISLNRENLFEIIDFAGGIKDLKNKKLKILHDKSFYDDASRIIRGLKFAERLDFSLDDYTKKLQKEYLEKPLPDIPLVRVKKEIKDLFSLNYKKCFDDFVSRKLYKIFVPDFDLDINGEKIKETLVDFDVKEEDIWLLYFLPFFAKSEPSQKFNFSARELDIIKDIQTFTSKEPVFEDKYSVYEYFINKDYLSAVFYGMMKNLQTAKIFFKIKDVKTEITGQDLIDLKIPQGKIYSEIQKSVLKEKINNGLKNKEQEIDFVRRNFIRNSETKA